jgi:hypothetical protein
LRRGQLAYQPMQRIDVIGYGRRTIDASALRAHARRCRDNALESASKAQKTSCVIDSDGAHASIGISDSSSASQVP